MRIVMILLHSLCLLKSPVFSLVSRLLVWLANFIAINCNKLVNQIGAVQTENVDFSLIVCYNQIQ